MMWDVVRGHGSLELARQWRQRHDSACVVVGTKAGGDGSPGPLHVAAQWHACILCTSSIARFISLWCGAPGGWRHADSSSGVDMAEHSVPLAAHHPVVVPNAFNPLFNSVVKHCSRPLQVSATVLISSVLAPGVPSDAMVYFLGGWHQCIGSYGMAPVWDAPFSWCGIYVLCVVPRRPAHTAGCNTLLLYMYCHGSCRRDGGSLPGMASSRLRAVEFPRVCFPWSQNGPWAVAVTTCALLRAAVPAPLRLFSVCSDGWCVGVAGVGAAGHWHPAAVAAVVELRWHAAGVCVVQLRHLRPAVTVAVTAAALRHRQAAAGSQRHRSQRGVSSVDAQCAGVDWR